MNELRVQIVDDSGEVIWMRDAYGGVASRGYVGDGTQARIIEALYRALDQAKFELGAFK